MEAAIWQYIDETKLYVQIPNGGKWVRPWLKEELGCIPESFRDSAGTFWWRVSKRHSRALQELLTSACGSVWVMREYSLRQACTSSCQNAKGKECICCCGGKFHKGTAHEWNNVQGELLISSERKIIARYFTRNGEEDVR